MLMLKWNNESINPPSLHKMAATLEAISSIAFSEMKPEINDSRKQALVIDTIYGFVMLVIWNVFR